MISFHSSERLAACGCGSCLWCVRACVRAARAEGVDGVFFDEGDSFACHYSCKQHNTCKTMPNAVEWQQGAIQAWKLAAEEMAKVVRQPARVVVKFLCV
jgi:hypothetical protein